MHLAIPCHRRSSNTRVETNIEWTDRFTRYLWKQFACYSSRINSGWHWQPGIYNCLCAWLEVDVQRRLIKRLQRRRLDDAFPASAAVANVTPFIDDLLNVSARQSAAPRRAKLWCCLPRDYIDVNTVSLLLACTEDDDYLLNRPTATIVIQFSDGVIVRLLDLGCRRNGTVDGQLHRWRRVVDETLRDWVSWQSVYVQNWQVGGADRHLCFSVPRLGCRQHRRLDARPAVP